MILPGFYEFLSDVPIWRPVGSLAPWPVTRVQNNTGSGAWPLSTDGHFADVILFIRSDTYVSYSLIHGIKPMPATFYVFICQVDL